MKPLVLALVLTPVAIAPVALVGAFSQQEAGRVYPFALDEMRARLLEIRPARFIFGNTDVDLDARRESETRVVWTVKARGSEVMRYIADLAPEEGGKATRVVLSVLGATPGRFGNVEERLAQRPAIRNFHVAAMEERIASRIERRQFRMSSLYPALGAATLASMDEIKADFDRMAEANQRRSRENIEKAYRREAAGLRN